MAFPATLETYTTRSTGDVIQADHINALQTVAENIQIKVGVDSSAVATTLDYLLKNASSSDPGHVHTTAGISGQIAVAQGGTGSGTAGGARTNLGLVIGTDVQAYDAGLADVAGLAVTNGNVIVGDGANWVAESGATFRTSIGLGNVEDTALSTWAGTANITTLGTITTGTLGSGAVLAGVTMTLGSDADGDVYYRNGGVLTRLAKGSDADVLTLASGVPSWAAAGAGGIVETDTDLDFTGTPTSYYMQLGYDPAANLDLEYIKISNTGATYEFDGVMLGIDHSAAGYSTGKMVISARHQGSGTTLGTATIELKTSGFNRLGVGGVDLYVDSSKTVVAGYFAVGTGTKFVGYNEGAGGSSTGTVRFYSAYTGGDVALGTASGTDDIWSLENHKFSSTLEQDVNASGVAARFNQQGAGDILEAEDNGTTAFLVDANGSTRAGKASLATSATDGFLYIPSCAGAPTGTPTTVTGMLPLVIDDTSNQLYFYDGSSWVAVN